MLYIHIKNYYMLEHLTAKTTWMTSLKKDNFLSMSIKVKFKFTFFAFDHHRYTRDVSKMLHWLQGLSSFQIIVVSCEQTYREFSPYANFITAIFVTAIFQNHY